MRFKFVTVGWNCADVAERTLRSIESQSMTNYDVYLVDDASTDDTGRFLDGWCAAHNSILSPVLTGKQSWHVQHNRSRQFVVLNQYMAIHVDPMDDDDVVIFLDLDGDQLAHPYVLERLAAAYDRGALVTYGSFRNASEQQRCPITMPFPPDVVAANAYRAELARGQLVYFNHLRTMAGVVAKAVPDSYLKFDDGTWYTSATDYAFMAAALELAGGRYESIPEVLCIYNDRQPHPDNMTQPDATVRAAMHTFRRRPLSPLEVPA